MHERRWLVLRRRAKLPLTALLLVKTERSKQAPLMNPAFRFSVFTPCEVSQEAKRFRRTAAATPAGDTPGRCHRNPLNSPWRVRAWKPRRRGRARP